MIFDWADLNVFSVGCVYTAFLVIIIMRNSFSSVFVKKKKLQSSLLRSCKTFLKLPLPTNFLILPIFLIFFFSAVLCLPINGCVFFMPSTFPHLLLLFYFFFLFPIFLWNWKASLLFYIRSLSSRLTLSNHPFDALETIKKSHSVGKTRKWGKKRKKYTSANIHTHTYSISSFIKWNSYAEQLEFSMQKI